jgi:hypothetical protein
MCGYVARVPDKRGSVCCASQDGNHDNPAHMSRNRTLYDIPPILFVFQVTHTDPRSSVIMADYCRNM